MKRFFRSLRKRPVALVSFTILILLYGFMIFADFLSPYHPATVFRDNAYYPPNLSWYSGELGFRPQVQEMILTDQLNWRYAGIRGRYVPVEFFVRGSEYRFLGLFRTDIHLFGTSGSGSPGGKLPVYLFGADHLGRDMYSRILHGSRISLTIGFVGITISLTIAILLGGLAGYYGGWVDWLIMRSAEFVILIPGLYLILFLRSVFSRDMDSGQAFILITVILSFVGWPGSARLIRGMVHSIKREDFISEAQLQGIPSLVIIFRQIIPQMASIIIISITLGIPGFILGETLLSYLGLGIVDPAVSWGSLLNRNLTTLSNLIRFPWFLTPGVFLILTTLAFNFLGDLLRDVLDPYYHEKRIG